ncbi:MAG TPA: hypothetical protein VIO83_12025, partial [Pseudomonas sp.]
ALRRPPPAEQLAAIPGVAGAHPQGEGRWLVSFEPGADPTDALVHSAAIGDWGLYELTRPRLSLEDVFLELAGDEVPESAPAQEQAA